MNSIFPLYIEANAFEKTTEYCFDICDLKPFYESTNSKNLKSGGSISPKTVLFGVRIFSISGGIELKSRAL